jgi:predicted amidohydrolase
MFDVDLPGGESWRESRLYHPGNEAVVADLPWARVGMSICYDLRFPQLFRALAHAGATILAIPAAFTKQTGQAHWHVLLRARAIETGSFVVAAAQGGKHEDGRETFGHSMVKIDPSASLAVRTQIPALTHDRDFEVSSPIKIVAAS